MPTIHSDQSSGSGIHVRWPRIAGFTLLEPLHEGSTSSIYRARQDRLGRVVALKLVSEWPPPTDVALERFNRAAYVYAQAPHPNLVSLFEMGTRDGYHFVTMEYLAGQCLQKQVGAGCADERMALHVAQQVLRALEALHDKDICHRNLKPKNIFVESNGSVRVLGMGLASCKSAFFSPHLDARPIGTPHFMSPEMIRGVYADPRSDLYSLGVTLYVIVTGHPPFEKGSPLAVMSRHLTDNPAPLHDVRSDLSTEFVQLVGTLMAREPEQRFQSAKAALEYVDALIRRNESGPARRLIPEILFGHRAQPVPALALPLAMQIHGSQGDQRAHDDRCAQTSDSPQPSPRPTLLRPLAIAFGSALATLLMLAGVLQIAGWLGKGPASQSGHGNGTGAPVEAPAVAPRAGEDAEGDEFARLTGLDEKFRATPVAGAKAWSGYLERFPDAPPGHRTGAKARRDMFMELAKRHRPDNLDF